MIAEPIKEYKLTQYSHGAGCGCKISPAVLDQILKTTGGNPIFKNLLVGNEERDDAAVMDLGDGTAIISTTDFFMPIVDNPEDFGRIASVNAISDIYAMGGTPILAVAILGWPIDKLPPEVANQVIEGSRKACIEAGIPLAGGHSIDSPEPIFGLAVTGRIDIKNLKKNGGAQPGASLFLTKPLGVGILTTAQKKGKLKPEHANIAKDSMSQLNKIGTEIGKLEYVEAMTDVTASASSDTYQKCAKPAKPTQSSISTKSPSSINQPLTTTYPKTASPVEPSETGTAMVTRSVP